MVLSRKRVVHVIVCTDVVVFGQSGCIWTYSTGYSSVLCLHQDTEVYIIINLYIKTYVYM